MLRVLSGRQRKMEGGCPFSSALGTRKPLGLATRGVCGHLFDGERRLDQLLEAEEIRHEASRASWASAAAGCCCALAGALEVLWPQLAGSAQTQRPAETREEPSQRSSVPRLRESDSQRG